VCICVCLCVCVYISALLFCQKGVGHIFLYRYLSSVPASQEWGRRSIDLGEGDSPSVKRTGAWYWSNYKLQFSLGWPLSSLLVHSPMMVFSAQLAEGSPTPFHSIYPLVELHPPPPCPLPSQTGEIKLPVLKSFAILLFSLGKCIWSKRVVLICAANFSFAQLAKGKKFRP
jgi:hypothetical protein